MNFIKVYMYGGSDWHDSFSTNIFLKEKGSFSITNVNKTIVDYIVDFIDDNVNYIEDERRKKIVQVATKEEIEEAMKNKDKALVLFSSEKQEFVSSTTGESIEYAETEAIFNAEKMEIEESYYCGQISYTHYIEVYDIAETDVRYLVCENFRCPNKGVSSIERMYHLPVKTQDEAEKIFSEMKLHKEGECENVWASSEKELLIYSVDNLLCSEWYSQQVIAINKIKSLENTIKSYGNKGDTVPFAMYVDQHIELVSNKEKELLRAHMDRNLSA